MPQLDALGIDAAFANMGFARVKLLVDSQLRVTIECMGLRLVETEVIEDRKVVRKSSTELRRARELTAALSEESDLNFQPAFVFAEVPSGSQSAQAARALGIAVGVLASCRAPIIEVSAHDVKEAVLGRRGKGKMPTKAEVIAWAMARWPAAHWLRGNSKGKRDAILAKNEHLADALAAVYAGVQTAEFRRALEFMPKHRARRDL